jgi:hypothetical protein
MMEPARTSEKFDFKGLRCLGIIEVKIHGSDKLHTPAALDGNRYQMYRELGSHVSQYGRDDEKEHSFLCRKSNIGRQYHSQSLST